MKVFGVCNDVNEQLNRCLRKEREENRAKNKARGHQMREKGFANQQNSA